MRIAIFGPGSYPRVMGNLAGGIIQYVAAMAEGYTSLGHDVHVFARGPESGTDALGEATVHYTKAAEATGLRRVAAIPVDELRTVRAFRRLAARARFDVIEVIDWNTPALLSAMTARRTKMIVKLHGPRDYFADMLDFRQRRLERVAAWRERRLAKGADLLCSADAKLALEMTRVWRLSTVPPTIPDPVHPPETPPPRAPADSGEAFRIIAVGRLEPRKDPLTFIRALSELGSVLPWTATIVGPDTPTPEGGSYKTAMLSELDDGISERVSFIDHASRQELWQLYARSDVAVVCSLDGNFGYTTMDPMTVGLAVITTSPDGKFHSPYVRDGKTALVYRSGNYRELARHLARLAADRTFAAHLGHAGREHVLTHLTSPKIAGRVLDALA
jgi:glycosyltransferase involved in cell wall biosynthesis